MDYRREKPIALRALELFPPRLLAEVCDFIANNGRTTIEIVQASRSSGNGLPAVLWPVDSFTNPDHRHQALTALALHFSSLEQAVADEGWTTNYWQVLSNRVLGSAQDDAFKKTIKSDALFDYDEAEDQMDDWLTKEQRKTIEASNVYKAASDDLKAALAGNGKYLTMLRTYGKAVEELSDRATDIVSYYRHHQIRINPPMVFGGDAVGPESFEMSEQTARELRGDIMIDSSANPYTGGFFKKIGKALKKGLKVVAPIAGAILPGPIGTAASLLAGRGQGQAQPAQPQVMPAPEPSVTPAPGGGTTVTLPSTQVIGLDTPQGQLLWHAATQSLARTPGSPLYGRFNGDVAAASPATSVSGKPVVGYVVATDEGPALAYPTFSGEVVVDKSCSGATECVDHIVRDHLSKFPLEERRRIVADVAASPALQGGPIDWLKEAGKNLLDRFVDWSAEKRTEYERNNTPFPARVPPAAPAPAPSAPGSSLVSRAVEAGVQRALGPIGALGAFFSPITAGVSLLAGLKSIIASEQPRNPGFVKGLGRAFQARATAQGDAYDTLPSMAGDSDLSVNYNVEGSAPAPAKGDALPDMSS